MSFLTNLHTWNEKYSTYLPKVALLVTLVFFIALMMTYKGGPDQKLLDSTATMEFVLKQANILPITYISPVMSYSSYCFEGYEKVIFKKWGGTLAGCSCIDKNLTGACSTNRFGCVSLDAIPQTDITLWKGVGYCVKRATKYADKYSNGSCPSGMKACPSSCVSLDDACPINSFTILNTYNGSDSNQIPLNTGEAALYSTNGTDRPVANLTVSFFDTPCITPTYHPSPKNGSVHFLEIEKTTGCSSFATYQLASKLDEASLSSVFDDNLLTKDIVAVPGYSDLVHSNKAYLYATSIMDINRTLPTCQNFQDALPSQLLSSTSKLYSTLQGFKWVIFILTGFVVIGMFFERPAQKLYDPEDRRAICVTMGVIALLALLELFLVIQGRIVSHQKNSTYIPTLNYMTSISSCFRDQQAQTVLASFISSYEDFVSATYTWANISFLVSVIILVLLIASLIIKFGLRVYAEKEEDEELYQQETHIELLIKKDTKDFFAKRRRQQKNLS